MKDLAEFLNSNDVRPVCRKGQVTLEPLAPDELGITDGYLHEHPEGSDRGGYVPTVFTASGSAYYDENAGEWFRR